MTIIDEKLVLGRVLRGCMRYEILGPALQTHDYKDERNALIADAFFHVHADGKRIDLITTMQQLESLGQLKAAGGAAYLAELADAVG